MIHRKVIRLLSAGLLAGFALGCGDDDLPTSTAPFVEITPPFTGILEGSTQQLTATTGGQPVAVTWASSNNAVATVSSTGLVTAVSGGFAAITATPTSNTELSPRSASVTVIAPPTLTSGTPVTNISSSGARGSTQLWKIIVPAGRTNLQVTLSGGTGDVDLYVRQGTPPTFTNATCASENGGNTELCNIPNPAAGTWYVMLGLWDPYAGVTLTATVTP